MKKFLPLVALLMSMIVSSCNKSNGVESLPEQEQPEPHLESVNFIPQNNSEQVIVDATENISSAVAQFQFQLTPHSFAATLATSWKNIVSMYAVRGDVNSSDHMAMPIKMCSVDVDSGVITVVISLAKLPSEFFTGKMMFSVFLQITDNQSIITSDYIPLVVEIKEEPEPEPEPVKIVNIPDNSFKNYLLALYDIDGDNEISEDEAKSVENISCANREISDLTGVEYFVNLKSLDCSGNSITALNLRKNTDLINFSCSGTQVTDLNLSNNKSLQSVNCANNPKLINIILWDDVDFGKINLSIDSGKKIINTNGESIIKVGSILTVNGGKGIVYQSDSVVKLISCNEMSGPWSVGIDWSVKYGTSGWVLPSIDELSAVYREISTLNTVLVANNLTPISGQYWSYTVYNKYDAYGINFADGSLFPLKVTYTLNVRSSLIY